MKNIFSLDRKTMIAALLSTPLLFIYAIFQARKFSQAGQ